jgi:hypothetical protein
VFSARGFYKFFFFITNLFINNFFLGKKKIYLKVIKGSLKIKIKKLKSVSEIFFFFQK